MLHRGYLNYFEQECCFVAIKNDRFFAALKLGDWLLCGEEKIPVQIHQGPTGWVLHGEGKEWPAAQGTLAWYEDSE